MKEFLLLFRGGDHSNSQPTPEAQQAIMQKWTKWMGGLQKDGNFVGGQPLSQTGKQVTGNKKVISDGPFMEGKEYVGGYLMIKAENLNAAAELSKGCPILEYDNGNVEIREIQDMNM